MFFVLLVSSFSLMKQVCDLRAENLRLNTMLELETQKDAVLKQVVKESVPEQMFMRSGQQVKSMDVVISAPVKEPGNWIDVDLTLLWSSPRISHCDMRSVVRMLFSEIYRHGEEVIKTL